jgi:hypothetical protein
MTSTLPRWIWAVSAVSAHLAATLGHLILLPAALSGLPQLEQMTAHQTRWVVAQVLLIAAALLYPLSVFAFARACHRLPPWLIPVAVGLTTVGAIALVDEHARGLAALALARSLDAGVANAALAAMDGFMASPLRLVAGAFFWLGQAILLAAIALDRDLRYPVGIPLAIGLMLLPFIAWPWPQRLTPLAFTVAAGVLARRGKWETARSVR